MFGFCRNSNCNIDTVREANSEGNFEIMSDAFTQMCTSTHQQLSPEELRAYGVDVTEVAQCPGPSACTSAHDLSDLRRPLFLPNGQLAYWPVLCTQQSNSVAGTSESGSQQNRVCPQGDYCQSAHTMKEILYHPLTFKTTPCQVNHEQTDQLKVLYCPYFHSQLDKRDVSSLMTTTMPATKNT